MSSIQEISEAGINDSKWEELQEQDTKTTIFQTNHWMEFETSHTSAKNISKLIELKDGREAILPLNVRKYEEGLRSKIARGVSPGENAIYGGLISESEISQEEETKIIKEVSRQTSKGLVPKQFSITRNPLKCTSGENFTQIVRTDNSFSNLLDNHKKNARSCYRQPRDDDDITIRKELSKKNLESFYKLYQRNLERWEDPTNVYSREFYEGLIKALPKDKIDLKIVQHSEKGDIGALLNIRHNKHVYMFMNCMDYENRNYYPNNYSITTSLKEYAQDTTKYFDMGASSGIEGLVKFKESFGSEKYHYISYQRSNIPFRYLKHALNTLRERKITP
jgi:hypothetical protein